MEELEPDLDETHTNRELALMLAGDKPFAVFAHERVDGFEKADALAGQDFAPHVSGGTMTEHVRRFVRHRADGAPVDVDYYFYAMPGEDWRVDAYCLLLELLHRGEWSASLEWMEGRLLGYTNAQIARHIARNYATGSDADPTGTP